jgi:hypothetical protein
VVKREYAALQVCYAIYAIFGLWEGMEEKAPRSARFGKTAGSGMGNTIAYLSVKIQNDGVRLCRVPIRSPIHPY